MKNKYFIQDWAGNDKSPYYGEFESVEDAFDALFEEFKELDDDALEDAIGEFYIEERGAK